MIMASNGNDLLKGTDSSENINGLGGNDTIIGYSGNDTLFGGIGNDSLDGGGDNDKLQGDAGVDTLVGGSGNDYLNGGKDNDVLRGDNGNDTLNGGIGSDNLAGGDGDDLYIVDNVRDTITETSSRLGGIDSVQSSVNYILASNVEKLTLRGMNNLSGTGSDGPNTIIGNSGDNFLSGMNGNDVLKGDKGDDTLLGGGGVDTLIGGDGSDTYQVSSLEDIIIETQRDGDQDVVASSVSYVLGDNVEVLSLLGSASDGAGNELDNLIDGNDVGNTLEGNDGNDDIQAHVGDDTIDGGAGDDTIDGGDGNDQVIYQGYQGDYKITFDVDSNMWTVQDVNGTDGDGVDEGIDSISNVETLIFADGDMSIGPVSIPTSPSVSILGTTIIEGNTGSSNVQMTINLSAGATQPVSVNYATSDGSAIAENDYTATNGTLTFAVGEIRKTILVPVTGDFVMEGDENFSIQLSAPSNATLTTNNASVTIIDDDKPTPGNDTLIGQSGNDDIDSLSGNDSVSGSDGNDTLTGGDGNDSLQGENGNDQLLGGDGNDTLTDSNGNNTLSGGMGDDRFVIDGSGNGSTMIEDIGGNDTVDASGASSGVVINLTSGQTSTVGGQTITLSSGGSVSDPLDMFFLQDLTGSFSDDISMVRTIVPQVISAIRTVQSDSLVGLGSFMDKPIEPFGFAGDGSYGQDYVYRTDLTMTSDQVAFSAALNTLSIGFGNDVSEAQLEALMQVALRCDAIGFRSDAVKTVVLLTDALYHHAGDGAAAGISTPNNGDSVLNGTPAGTGEDYPTVAMVASALWNAGIVPIFAVTSNNTATYTDLVSQLGTGSVVTLSSNSANLVNVIQSGIGAVTVATVENAIGSAFPDTLNGDANANTLDGQAGADTLNGGNGNDKLLGGTGDDSLVGGVGNDLLDGGMGKDVLNGGPGNDHFIFHIGDSGVGLGNRDVISDFNAVSTTEWIDVSQLAASPLSFIGNASFTGAGQVRYAQDAATGATIVQINLDADTSAPEMEIQLTGTMTLTGGDFFLG